jgi:hypothetical protein
VLRCVACAVEPPPRVDEVPAAEEYDSTFKTVHAAPVGESDTILIQFELTMMPLTDAIEHRDALQVELNALRADKRDFLNILAVADVLQAANAQVEIHDWDYDPVRTRGIL